MCSPPPGATLCPSSSSTCAASRPFRSKPHAWSDALRAFAAAGRGSELGVWGGDCRAFGSVWGLRCVSRLAPPRAVPRRRRNLAAEGINTPLPGEGLLAGSGACSGCQPAWLRSCTPLGGAVSCRVPRWPEKAQFFGFGRSGHCSGSSASFRSQSCRPGSGRQDQSAVKISALPRTCLRRSRAVILRPWAPSSYDVVWPRLRFRRLGRGDGSPRAPKRQAGQLRPRPYSKYPHVKSTRVLSPCYSSQAPFHASP